VASGLVVIAIAWCVKMRGPMFVSVFNPLMLLLVAVADSLMLGENLYVGRYNINQLIKSNDFFFLKKVSLSHEKLLFFP